LSSKDAGTSEKVDTPVILEVKDLKLLTLTECTAVLWLRWLVAALSKRRPGLAPGSFYTGFVVDKVALGQVFL
jgi:hypothetical protein